MNSRRIVTALMRIQETVQNLGVCRPSVSEDDRTEGGEIRLIRVAMTYRLCSPPRFWTVSLRWRRRANARSGWARGRKRKPSRPRRWRNQPWWRRNRSNFPSMEAMSGRFVIIRCARSRSCSPRSQMTTGSRSFSAACPQRLFPNRISCAAFFINWARQPSVRSRFSAMGRKVRARSAKRPVQAQLIMSLTDSTFRCGFSMLIRRPTAGRTSPRAIARRVRISLKSSIGFAGVCGTARSLGPSISPAKRWSRSTESPTARSRPP